MEGECIIIKSFGEIERIDTLFKEKENQRE